MNQMRPVNEKLHQDALDIFSGPMSIPKAIGSYHRMGEKKLIRAWKGSEPVKNGSLRRDRLY